MKERALSHLRERTPPGMPALVLTKSGRHFRENRKRAQGEKWPAGRAEGRAGTRAQGAFPAEARFPRSPIMGTLRGSAFICIQMRCGLVHGRQGPGLLPPINEEVFSQVAPRAYLFTNHIRRSCACRPPNTKAAFEGVRKRLHRICLLGRSVPGSEATFLRLRICVEFQQSQSPGLPASFHSLPLDPVPKVENHLEGCSYKGG